MARASSLYQSVNNSFQLWLVNVMRKLSVFLCHVQVCVKEQLPHQRAKHRRVIELVWLGCDDKGLDLILSIPLLLKMLLRKLCSILSVSPEIDGAVSGQKRYLDEICQVVVY